jgi:polysaccharide export outer membrane protein
MNRRKMKAVIVILVILGANMACRPGHSAEPTAAAPPVNSPQADYIIGSGDILDISVWKEPDLAKRVTVLPDGNISFPLIGQIRAAGLTLNQLKKQIEKKILRFVPHPNLTVAVYEINSLYVYIVGKVYKAGRFEMNTNIDVLQALAMAGGLNPFAKKSKIKVFRKQQDRTRIFDFDYDQVSEGKNLDQNLTLQRGDVIVVP